MKKKVTWGQRRRALKKVAFFLGVFISVSVLLCRIMSCGNNPLKPEKTTDPTVQLISEKCSTCHTLDKVRDYKGDNWEEVVDDMIDKGAELTKEEAAKVIAYLEEGKSF